MKMVQETGKILGREIPLNATCVRVPVVSCHSEALSIKFENKFNINDIYREVYTNVKDESYKMGDMKIQEPTIDGNF